jgi:hypothetical protein
MSICLYHLKTHAKSQGFETKCFVQNIRGEGKKYDEAIIKGFFCPLYSVVYQEQDFQVQVA